MWWLMLFTGTAQARVELVSSAGAGFLDLTRLDVCYVIPLDDPELDLSAFLIETPVASWRFRETASAANTTVR